MSRPCVFTARCADLALAYHPILEIPICSETVVGCCRKGMDLYFKRHDGQAVTCDDFLAAMADANNQDLSHVARWCGASPPPPAYLHALA